MRVKKKGEIAGLKRNIKKKKEKKKTTKIEASSPTLHSK